MNIGFVDAAQRHSLEGMSKDRPVSPTAVSQHPATAFGEGPSLGTRPRKRRWLAVLGTAALVLVIGGLATLAYIARHAEPILSRRVVVFLEARFRRPVELDSLHISVVKGLEVSGSGLRILRHPEPSHDPAASTPDDRAPLLAVDNFQFHTGIRALLGPAIRIATLRVQGMQLNIPPREERDALFPREDSNRRRQPGFRVAIDQVICTDTTLTIETAKPGKPPRVFDIQNLTLTDVGPDTPFHFDASLVNPVPKGDIHAIGHFGPWKADGPRDSNIDGSYTFTNADLYPIKGIGGTLSSIGKFSGTLDQINVSGTTETPDFNLDVSEHPVPLHTEFQAIVDGTSGDTTLTSVHATLGQSDLQANGTIFRTRTGDRQPPGHNIELTVSSSHARIDDILRLGAKTSPPLMHGALTLHARLSIPSGAQTVAKKIRLHGNFTLNEIIFSNPKFQETVDKLSVRATGDLEEPHPDGMPVVASHMDGSFALASAVVHLPGLNYKIPGADVHLAGDYSLDGQTFEFAGTVRTQATASEMLTGWKSLLAKPFDGLLKKNGAGLEVPIKISGTRSDPKLNLDFAKMFTRHKDTTPPPPPAP
jgi:hypothetical protein